MIGAVLVSATANPVLSLSERSRSLRLTGQLIIGCAIGIYLRPESLQSVFDRILLIILSAVLLNPFFLGPMIAVGIITATGTHLSGMPPWLTSAAQVLLGVSIGSMMKGEQFRSAGRFVATILATTAALFLDCIGIAALFSGALGENLYAMLLATAPGGATEMVITASAAHLDVPLVAAFHIVRIFLIMSIIQVVYRIANQI